MTFHIRHLQRPALVGGIAIAATAALCLTGGLAASATTGSGTAPQYTVTTGSLGDFGNPDDTPASPFIDSDGTFYYSESHSLYGANDPREWTFYKGTTMDDAQPDNALNTAANPADPSDANNDTTARCNNSPTGLTSTYAPAGSGYAQRNYCDLTQQWVDPDTGDWYGLVHNEFTPQPFGDGLHYDALDFAVSKDHGQTWTIEGHAITSPYSTTRGDTAAFPRETYYYGDGDPRLYVDTASGYFYVYYGSRVVDKNGSWKAFYEHVARAPIADKMATGSWQKWYDGTWKQPGVGGKESNLVPVSSTNTNGYTPAANEYNPATPGTASQQIAAGLMPATSPLFVMDVTYDAYLGLYIGEPQNPDQSGNAPQQYYATKNLATQKWFLLGDSGSSFTTASWYRWFIDPANATSTSIVGKTFRSYCAWACADGSDGDYANVTVDSSSPAATVDTSVSYRIATGNGLELAQVPGRSSTTSTKKGHSALGAWRFSSTGDGAYTITNVATGKRLGVDSSSTASRAWGTAPSVQSASTSVGQQWFVVSATSPSTGEATGTVRLVNRYSGLVLALTGSGAGTAPGRSWDATSANPVDTAPLVSQQTVSLVKTPNGGHS
ncbi:RICIN domain-containing protein [Planctomonas sp. JC2975]|uniref:RICIN domain-containing protein n=1 Tax=Planctomonas sp. JC2975 TaxID=2729626 RepID=UPI001473B601|nr:RICIN domain-containing protein [Planctomonas sp. JC2975]NNC11757.1 RICIN domain-containing protein [Planctomonas sp. JC2975]